jgi:Tetrapyrrole (Corrin/Porphyrin) Methylases
MTRALSLLSAGFLAARLSLAFLPSSIRRSSPRSQTFQHHYITDPSSTCDFSDGNKPKIIEDNEWGIPHHTTLEPLGPKASNGFPDQLPNGGRVTLVGAGPGDPDLLTVAAYKLLTEDPNALVISDRLVAQEILDLIPGQVKVARKLPGCAELAQEEIFSWVHAGLKQGKHVIRLKIGDPFVFGRGGEEVLVFRDFGVEAKVVPVSLLVEILYG